MSDIIVLSKQMAELIAAGEVVERPASVIKELIENSIDAKADKITVEIQHGGSIYMRITDNGSGIKNADVKKAFLRHATSKIKTESDLYSIATLGFRGEALASISAVAKVEIITKTKEENTGTRYVIEGGEEKLFEETGCPDGTTIIVRELFYNTPARMKFLRKDASESSAVGSIIDAIALSHPEISIKFIKDGKLTLSTQGDSSLKSVIYTVLGREFASSLIPVNTETNGIKVSGMLCKPIYCKATRSGQYFFLNKRLIRSGAASKALDEAYKNAIMVGKFPAGVLNIEIPFDRVDVNVHPAKTEVRFSDERAVFEAVYYAAKNALNQGDTRPELKLNNNIPKSTPKPFEKMTTKEFKREFVKNDAPTLAEQVYMNPEPVKNRFADYGKPIIKSENTYISQGEQTTIEAEIKTAEKIPAADISAKIEEIVDLSITEKKAEEDKVIFIGEAFKTYIIAQQGESIYLIDKHAAHERILFEKLKKEQTPDTQKLLSAVAVSLSRSEKEALLDNINLLEKAGFEVEEFGGNSVLVRAIPSALSDKDVDLVVGEMAANLLSTGKAENEMLSDLYHSVACRAAVKAGNVQGTVELQKLATEVLLNNDIKYCPHDRPVAFEIKLSQLEKQFGRKQ